MTPKKTINKDCTSKYLHIGLACLILFFLSWNKVLKQKDLTKSDGVTY